MPTDISKLEALLAENKLGEAAAVINEAVSGKMTDAQKGEAMSDIASVYMDIYNNIGDQYKAALETAIAGMKKINASESASNDKARLAEVRKGLGQ